MKAAKLTEHPSFRLMRQTDVQNVWHMQMPRWLFSDPRYADMSLDAKVTYTFLLNRFQLSRRNGWVNDAGEVFVIFPRKALAKEQSEKTDKENGNYSSEYGYLYTYEAALAAVPEGWRLPTDEDWKKLEAALGMEQSQIDLDNTWRGINAGDYLKQGGASGFNALFAGCNAYVPKTNGMNYIKKQEGAYFWTSDIREVDVSGSTENDATRADDDDPNGDEDKSGIAKVAKYRILTLFSPKIWRGDTRIDNGYRSVAFSVRCVKDAK